MHLYIHCSILAANFVYHFRLSINVHCLMTCCKRIVLYVCRGTEHRVLNHVSIILRKGSTLPHQSFNLLYLIEIIDLVGVIIWHYQEQIIASATDCNIQNILFIQEQAIRRRYTGRRIQNSKNNITFIPLETVDCTDLNSNTIWKPFGYKQLVY